MVLTGRRSNHNNDKCIICLSSRRGVSFIHTITQFDPDTHKPRKCASMDGTQHKLRAAIKFQTWKNSNQRQSICHFSFVRSIVHSVHSLFFLLFVFCCCCQNWRAQFLRGRHSARLRCTPMWTNGKFPICVSCVLLDLFSAFSVLQILRRRKINESETLLRPTTASVLGTLRSFYKSAVIGVFIE